MMFDSLYGNLLGKKPQAAKVQDDDMFGAPKESPKEQGDSGLLGSLYGDLPASGPKAQGPAEGPPQRPAPAAAPSPTSTSGAAQSAPSVLAMGPTKLLAPPVRKKAEPGKKPAAPVIDIARLQEEKEALMRQNARVVHASTHDDGKKAPAPTADDSAPTQALSTARAPQVQPDEEYDPTKPNDYDEYCRRRMRQKAEEEIERRRQADAERRRNALAGKPVEAPKQDDFATKMLKKMGWKEGDGLGKEGQGIAAPLILQKTDTHAGKIVEGSKRPMPQQPGQAQAQADPKKAKTASFNRPPTRVLLLNNLVGKGEVDDDLEGETAEEAGKYGKLVKCVVKEVPSLPDVEAVRIFLEFEKKEDATKALVDMNGRFFGGRVVKARFFDEARWAAGSLDPMAGE